MSYLVLARKFRPLDFKTISGQDQVTRPLSNAIKRGTVSHAFLFCGPRGVGKTSVARVLAKALNCEKGPTHEPCLKCTNCLEIAEGRSLAVREIDGASHNSVDNVRDLIDTLRSQPPPGSKYKVYIIDEVHMLSIAAFNALLKNLEEPPPNTVFILATTDPQKIPETVLSRCQRYDFREIPQKVIEARLLEVAEREGIKAEPEVFSMIARLADGSMRDAQSLLDRVRSLGDDIITAAETGLALGVVNRATLFNLSRAILDRSANEALAIVDHIFSVGLDPKLFLNELVAHWRELLIAKFSGKVALNKLGLNDQQLAELLQQASDVSPNDIQDLVHLVQSGCDAAIRSSYPKLSVEALVVRLATREPVQDLVRIIEELKKKQPSNESKNPTRQTANINLKSPLSNLKVSERATGFISSAMQKISTLDGSSSAAPLISDKITTPASVSEKLEWRDFVSMVSKSGKSAMPECLKRLSVEKFEPGILKAVAPKLAEDYFNDSDNKIKLVDYLNNFFKGQNWSVSISGAESSRAATMSIVDQEKHLKSNNEQKKRNSATAHPAIKNLKKFFPGTTFDA